MPHKKSTGQAKPVDPTPASVAANLNGGQAEFVPSSGDTARKAPFSYVSQGSRLGHEAQHWLAAEAERLAERKRTKANGLRHRP